MKKLKTFIVALLFLFLFFSLTRNIFDYQKNLAFYKSFKNEYEEERKKKAQLQTETMKSKDLNTIEKTLRNKLNLLKPGEISVIIPNPTPTPKIITPTPAPVYQQWLNTFFPR